MQPPYRANRVSAGRNGLGVYLFFLSADDRGVLSTGNPVVFQNSPTIFRATMSARLGNWSDDSSCALFTTSSPVHWLPLLPGTLLAHIPPCLSSPPTAVEPRR